MSAWSRAPRALAIALPLGVALAGGGCDAITDVAVQGASFGGATADAHCDRRFPLPGGQASSFCQDVAATVAATQFSDDCRNHLLATPGPGLCPRARIIAGCKLDKQEQDGSVVHDWYYDVSDLLADAGPFAGPDGGPTFALPIPVTMTDVARTCADRTRYEEGAELVSP
jgi:hypothetical protein